MNITEVKAQNTPQPIDYKALPVEPETKQTQQPLQAPETQTIALHANKQTTALSKPDVNIGSEDLIKLFDTQILKNWQEKYKLGNTSIAALRFTVKNFLDDNNLLRITCALGNEIAVAINESMEQWGFPKALANVLYYGLWAVAVVSCGARAVLRGLGTQNIKPFIESSIQDGIAAIFGPTGVVMIANKAQDAVYKASKFIPQSVINFVRPVISVVLAEMAIPKILDPIGKTVGKLVTGLISPETYSRWSDSISKKLGGNVSTSHAPASLLT